MNVVASTIPLGYGRALGVALFTCTVALGVSVAHAKTPAPGDDPAGPSSPDRPSGSLGPMLRIHVEPTINDARLLPRWITKRSLAAASEKAPPREGHEQWVAVVVGGDTYDYRVSVVAMRDGEPLQPAREPEVCVCNSDELLALVHARILAAAEALGGGPPTVSTAPAVVTTHTRVTDRPRQAEPVSRPELPPNHVPANEEGRRRLGPRGYVGIGLGVLGAGALGAGVPLILWPDAVRGPSGHAERLSTQPPGIAMAVGGGVALATGVVLLVVDLVRGRERSTSFVSGLESRRVSPSLGRRF